MTQPPVDYRDTDETLMSNLDHRIDRELERRLRAEKVVMAYTARNFCGECWFHNGQFHCLVRTWGIPRRAFSAETLEAIVDAVCEQFGFE